MALDSARITEDLWLRNPRPKHISVPAHGYSVVTCLLIAQARIITASDDHTISVFSLTSGERLRSLTGHTGGVWAVAVAGNTLVSGSTDTTLRVWDLDAGRCTHVFGGHTSTVRTLALAHPESGDSDWPGDGPLVVSGSRDHTLRVWKLPTPSETEYIWSDHVRRPDLHRHIHLQALHRTSPRRRRTRTIGRASTATTTPSARSPSTAAPPSPAAMTARSACGTSSPGPAPPSSSATPTKVPLPFPLPVQL